MFFTFFRQRNVPFKWKYFVFQNALRKLNCITKKGMAKTFNAHVVDVQMNCIQKFIIALLFILF